MRLTRGGVSRLPVVLVLGFLIAGAFVIERSTDDDVAPAAAATAAESPTITPAGVLSTAWYCAGGTAIDGGRADETIVLTNLGSTAVPVRLTVAGDVQADGSHASAASEVVVEPTSSQRVRVADLLVANEPGVTVEVFGGDVVVEHELVGNDDVSVSPCADDASTTWWVAAGTTRRGAQDWVEIYNPFADDAVVSLRFFTPAGATSRAGASDRVVEGHSRLSIPVHEELLREDSLGVEVVATTGRVVVDRTLIHDGSEGIEGLATTLAQPRLSEVQSFAGFQVTAGRTALLEIVNPSDTDAIVTVDVIGAQTAPPIADTLIPPGTQLVIDLTTYDTDPSTPEVDVLLPPDVWVSVQVDTVGSAPVAAEIVQESVLPDPVDGLEVLRATSTGSTRWVATAPALDAAQLVAISLHNPGAEAATVQLGVLGQAATGDPGLTQVVAPGQTVVVELPSAAVPPTTIAATTTTVPATTTTVPATTTTTVPATTTTTTTTTTAAGETTTTAAGETTTTTAASETTTTTAVETTTTTAAPTTTTGPPFTPSGAVLVPTTLTPGAAVVVTSDRPVVVLRVVVGSTHVVAATAVPGRPG